MKILQKIDFDPLTHPDWIWVENNYKLIKHIPKNEYEKLDKRLWHPANPDDVVKKYIKTNNLDWKVKLFVPEHERFAPRQGYTNYFKSLFEGLGMYGVEVCTNINHADGIFIFYSVWAGAKTGYIQTYKKIGKNLNIPVFMLTMFESDHWPQTFVDEMQYLDFLIVTNKFNKECLQNQGLKPPIYTLPICNVEGYEYIERPIKRDVFKFLHYNAFDGRKGFPEYIEAFNQEFKNENDVRLVLKSRDNDPNNKNAEKVEMDSKIEWIKANMSEEEIQKLHKDSDCFVFPTKGEGWGMPPIEALLTGNPVIVTKAIGTAEWFNRACLEVKGSWKPAGYGIDNVPQDQVGEWYVPDVDSLRKKMRWIYEEYKREGRNAKIFQRAKKMSQTIQNKYSNKRVAEQLIDILEEQEILKKIDNSN